MISLSSLPTALRDRITALLVAVSCLALLPLLGCGGGNLAPVPVPSTVTASDATTITVGPNDTQAQAARSIILATYPLAFLPARKTVTITTLSAPSAAIAYKIQTGQDLPSTVAGWYRRREDTGGDPAIYFVGDGWGDWLTHMALHEWAHFVQLDNCTEAEFAAWRTAYNSAKSRGALPSDYAETNEYEGWAESVTAMYTGGTLDPELRAVIDQVTARMSADGQGRGVHVPALTAASFTGCSMPKKV